MFILPWRAKRQLLYFTLFFLVALIIIGGLVWYFLPEPTCFDGRKNGEEEGVDCGGPCAPCTGEIKDISVLWTRVFKSKGEIYDAAALIENPNIFARLPSVKYQFKIYDANSVLIAVSEGQTFINSGERRAIFKSGISTGLRVPKYVYIEFEAVKKWKYAKQEKSFLSVIRKDFTNSPFPRLAAEIKNESFSDIKNIFVTAILYDVSGNASGISSTKIDSIPAESARSAFFSWLEPFTEEPSAIEVIAITDLTK